MKKTTTYKQVTTYAISREEAEETILRAAGEMKTECAVLGPVFDDGTLNAETSVIGVEGGIVITREYPYDPADSGSKSAGVRMIAAERDRHAVKGYTLEHDADNHQHGELAEIAAALALHPMSPDAVNLISRDPDPWDLIADHGHDRVRCLEIAGSLIAAEIDRLIEGG
jgi:hypothetical protein